MCDESEGGCVWWVIKEEQCQSGTVRSALDLKYCEPCLLFSASRARCSHARLYVRQPIGIRTMFACDLTNHVHAVNSVQAMDLASLAPGLYVVLLSPRIPCINPS